MKSRLGIFGGTFDPVHLGHIQFAKFATDELQLDRLFFVPAGQNPLKTARPSASGSDRVEMLRLALAEAGESKWSIYEGEAKKSGPSYTIDTVQTLQSTYPGEWVLLMGGEVFQSLPNWKNPALLLQKVQIALTVRPGQSAPDITEVLNRIESVPETPNIKILNIPTLDFSSTQLRETLYSSPNSARVSTLGPPPGLQRSVWQYIKEKQLYTDS